jgi:hypothetical protein
MKICTTVPLYIVHNLIELQMESLFTFYTLTAENKMTASQKGRRRVDLNIQRY